MIQDLNLVFRLTVSHGKEEVHVKSMIWSSKISLNDGRYDLPL